MVISDTLVLYIIVMTVICWMLLLTALLGIIVDKIELWYGINQSKKFLKYHMRDVKDE